MEPGSASLLAHLHRMRARLKPFWESIKNHPIIVAFLWIWPWAMPLMVWLVDKMYGDEAYEAIRRAITGTRWISLFDFLVAYWPQINATVFLSVLGLLFVQMWRESRIQPLPTTKPKRASARFEITSSTIGISDIHNINRIEEIGNGTLRISWTGEFLTRDEFLGPDYEIMATQTRDCNIDVIEKTPQNAVISIRPWRGHVEPMEFVIHAQGEESYSQFSESWCRFQVSMGRGGSTGIPF